MRMKKKIIIDFFSKSKKWSRRTPKIKEISSNIKKYMINYFNSDSNYFINLVLSDEYNVKILNKKYKNNNNDTDVLTFVNKITNKNLGKTLYCDIFFSIDNIESFIKKNKVNFYDHFKHLLIHSFLHINNYDHKNKKDFEIMKKEEIKILKKFGITNPYNSDEY